jgi:ElaA protein
MSQLHWECRQFSELSLDQLYALLQLRAEVFVLEQQCPYQDPDGNDQEALHVLGLADGQLLAYTRLLPPGIRYDSCSIGRVVTSKAIRGDGTGQQLMEKSIEYCYKNWGQTPITISAQQYLEKFYNGLGFETESEPYQEDGIPHIQMRLPPTSRVTSL